MSDLIERTKLVKNLKAIESATLKEKPKFIWESIYRQIKNEPHIEENTCAECLISLPRRKWHKIKDIYDFPPKRQKVLVQTEKGKYYVAYYCSECWWIEDRELGDISYFFNDEKIVKWKEID